MKKTVYRFFLSAFPPAISPVCRIEFTLKEHHKYSFHLGGIATCLKKFRCLLGSDLGWRKLSSGSCSSLHNSGIGFFLLPVSM